MVALIATIVPVGSSEQPYTTPFAVAVGPCSEYPYAPGNGCVPGRGSSVCHRTAPVDTSSAAQ